MISSVRRQSIASRCKGALLINYESSERSLVITNPEFIVHTHVEPNFSKCGTKWKPDCLREISPLHAEPMKLYFLNDSISILLSSFQNLV
jgi:hypothetical protein